MIPRKQDPNNLRSKNKAQSIVFTGKDVLTSVPDSPPQPADPADKNLHLPANIRKRATPAVRS